MQNSSSNEDDDDRFELFGRFAGVFLTARGNRVCFVASAVDDFVAVAVAVFFLAIGVFFMFLVVPVV